MCPYLEPNKLLKFFFFYYSQWDWKYNKPIYLVQVSSEVKYGLN